MRRDLATATRDGRHREMTAGTGVRDQRFDVGARLRAERERRKIGVRELAKRVGVSPSLISQIETNKSRPSVNTLYAIVNELQISLDQLFAGGAIPGPEQRPRSPVDQPPAAEPYHDASSGLVRPGARQVIQLDSGVTWERLTAGHDPVDFLSVTYRVGGESCPPDALMHHSGREYGYVLEGRLGVTVGFDEYELRPGDSISFESAAPHRLWNAGDEPVRAIWFVVGRNGPAQSGVVTRGPS
jgi:transcriptional regulator with XRE-family HTH domain